MDDSHDNEGAASVRAQQEGRLDSWKKIASYLRRDVSTVQRWERREGMPVRRHLHDKLGSVFAYRSELDTWWESRRTHLTREGAAETEQLGPTGTDASGTDPPPFAPLTPSPHEPAARDEAPSLAPSPPAAKPRRPRSPALALIAALAVAALLVGGYALWRARSAGVTSVRVETPAAALPARTVAVLPFENLSTEPSDGFLATGIAESVLHRLAAVKSLSVIARTSSFTFRGRDVDARDIGRKLNARYLVEGSVQRAGDRLRVTAQLLDASSGSDVWSLRLERHMGDIFELQDEISGKVTDAIGVSLAAEPDKTSPQGIPKLDAYLAYIEGRSLLSTFKIADAQTGVERLKRATTIDPNFAAAYAEEAHALRFLSWLLHPDGPTDPELERQAAALNDKALSLDPELGEAWVERAYGREQLAEGFDATTDAEFRKGLALAPNYAQGYELYGEWLSVMDRTDDALAMIERARQLDPLYPRSHYFKGLIMLEYRNEVDQAVTLFLDALRVSATYHPALTRLGEVEWLRGNFAEGTKFLERAIVVEPKAEWMRSMAALLYLDLGDAAAARDVLVGTPPTAPAQLCLLSYLGEEQRGAALLYALPRADLKAKVMDLDNDCATAVIRDDAFKRRDYGPSLRALEPCLPEDWDPILSRNGGDVRALCVIRYASILTAVGERDRAAKLLHAILTAMQSHKLYTSGERAEVRGFALALLGDTEDALTALETAYAIEKRGWWYDIDHAPELQGLRAHSRFQNLARQVRDNAAKQAALLATMCRAGDVPYRPPQSATTSGN